MILGSLGSDGRATIDPRGALTVVGEPWTLDWWIGADDRWRVPAQEPAVRQRALDGAPVAETRLKIPSGDAIQRVYGIGGAGGVVVVEVENASPAACIVAFVVRGATSIALDGAAVIIDGAVALILPFAPPRWDVTDVELEPTQCGAETGAFLARQFPAETLRATLLFPLSHRNRMRIGVVCGEKVPRLDLAQVPDAQAAARGWQIHLDRGMRVRGPAETVAAIDGARAQVLLDPDPGPAVAAALEDWGFDERAEWAWHGLTLRDRRAARRRDATLGDATPAGTLLAARDGYVREVDGQVCLLCAPPEPGIDIEVLDAPTRHGRISFALRWHGEHPALLWEVTDAQRGLELTAPVLAPGWSTREPVGETLLRPTAV